MYRRLREYLARVDALLAGQDVPASWDAVLAEHLAQTAFFQHERLVHLLVTLAFALMELVSAVATVVSSNIMLAVLMLALLVPLVPYVVHYYHLENGTQRLYEQYDQLARRAATHQGRADADARARRQA